jgi:translocation and assembly module TamB
MSTRAPWYRVLLALLAPAILVLALLDPSEKSLAQSGESDQGTIASLLSWALSTPANRVTVGAVKGALSSDVEVLDLRIADRDGVWLSVDRARLVWSRAALIARRLDIDSLQIDKMTLQRRPLADEADKAQAAEAPSLPALPVKLIVRKFALQELALGEPVLGTAARIGATGNAVLGRPSEGLSLQLAAQRLDAEGRADINIGYVPETGNLDLNIQLKEPEHGLLAHAGGLPGEPPIDLDLRGKGPIDNWSATLAYVSGPTVGANGKATITREGPARRIALDLTSRIEGLLPGPVAPVFAGTTALTGDILAGDDGSLAVRRFEVASRTGRLTLGGTIDAQRNLDLALGIHAVPTDGAATRAGSATVGRLAFDLTAKGPADAARVDGTLAAADLVSPSGRIGSATGKLLIEPPAAPPPGQANAGVVAAAQVSTVSLDVHLAGFVPSDAALARATGSTLDVAARGTALTDLTFDVERAKIATPTLETSFTGKVGTRVLRGQAKARIPDLAAFSGIAARELAGAADLTADLEGDPGRYTIRAALDGQVRDARIAVAAIDRLLAGTVTLKGVAERLPGGLGFQGLTIAGPHLSARLDGPATRDHASLVTQLQVPDLHRADGRLSGRAAGEVRLTGSLARPDVSATLDVADARSMNRPIPRLHVGVVATDLLGALDARLTASGEIDRKPLSAVAHAARQGQGPAETWALDGIDVAVGSVRLAGGLGITGDRRANGKLTVSAGDLDDLSPLVLMPLKGDLDAAIDLAVTDGRQNAHIAARSARLDVAGSSLRKLDALVDARDVYGALALDARVAADQVNAGAIRFDIVRFASKGSAEASDLTLSAKGLGLDLDAAGRLVTGTPLVLELQKFQARRGNERIALAGPARIGYGAGTVTLESFVLAAGRGRIAVSGKAGETLDLSAQATAVPLSLADIVSPGLGLDGTLDAKLQVAGTPAAPRGEYTIQLSRVAAAATRQAGLPPVDARASGRLADGRASVDASVTAPRIGTLTATGSVPVGQGALDLRVRGPLDAAAVNSFLAGAGQRVTGRVNVDLAIGGEVAKPRLSGSAQLSGGTFEDVLNGISFKAIEARLVGSGDTVTIERFTAATANGGTLAASGRIGLDPAAGFPADLRITGRRAQLVSSDVVSTVADLDLTIAGPLTRAPRIGGRIGIQSMDISIPEHLSSSQGPLPGTKHIKPGPAARARLAAAKAQGGSGRPAPAFVASFDLTIEAVNRIFVRGRGLQAELGGSLRLTGTTRDPVAIGAFNLRNGRIDLAGQRIDLVRGRVSFEGDLTPTLDFLAQTQAADVTAQIGISGRATEPAFAITSQPALPQDEVLSRILFSRATGGLTGFQALQLAQTIAQLSGGGGGGFDALRKSLGVDSLDVSSGSSGGPTVGVSRYLGPKLRVGVRAGATAADTGVGVDYDLTKRIKIRGQVGADGSAAAGAAVEWEY